MGVQPSTIFVFIVMMSTMVYYEARSVEIFRPTYGLNGRNRYRSKVDNIIAIIGDIDIIEPYLKIS